MQLQQVSPFNVWMHACRVPMTSIETGLFFLCIKFQWPDEIWNFAQRTFYSIKANDQIIEHLFHQILFRGYFNIFEKCKDACIACCWRHQDEVNRSVERWGEKVAAYKGQLLFLESFQRHCNKSKIILSKAKINCIFNLFRKQRWRQSNPVNPAANIWMLFLRIESQWRKYCYWITTEIFLKYTICVTFINKILLNHKSFNYVQSFT